MEAEQLGSELPGVGRCPLASPAVLTSPGGLAAPRRAAWVQTAWSSGPSSTWSCSEECTGRRDWLSVSPERCQDERAPQHLQLGGDRQVCSGPPPSPPHSVHSPRDALALGTASGQVCVAHRFSAGSACAGSQPQHQLLGLLPERRLLHVGQTRCASQADCYCCRKENRI